MIRFKTTLLKFDKQGEKTGWTYILVPSKLAEKLKPASKKSFRIKGKIDHHVLTSVALLPIGSGDFIMPVNAEIRKSIRKIKGAPVMMELEEDSSEQKLSAMLLACLKDDAAAKLYFDSLPGFHQQYFSKWIESAKTDGTKTKRVALALNAFSNKMTFSQMLRTQKKERGLF